MKLHDDIFQRVNYMYLLVTLDFMMILSRNWFPVKLIIWIQKNKN